MTSLDKVETAAGSALILLALIAAPARAAEYRAPRNEYGQPDLRGVWNFSSDVPLERAKEFADKSYRTREELYKANAARDTNLERLTQVAGGVGAHNSFWQAQVEAWMGHNLGRWEGDTLVIDVTDQKEDTWLDGSGNFHGPALRVQERYTPVGPNLLMYEATITDGDVFTRPWKISLPLYRRMDRNVQLLDFECVEFVEELMYSKYRKQPAEAKQ